MSTSVWQHVTVTSSTSRRSTYHHGDLARALVDAATELAEKGGPDAVVLREVARRTGVSPTAAYRHFQSQNDLLAAVGSQGMAGMAASMEQAQAAVRSQRDPKQLALARWRATGEGYVRFALQHPGMFRTAFAQPSPVSHLPLTAEHPYLLLCNALDDCVKVGLLSPEARVGADQLCWIGVHGLTVLVLSGELPGQGPPFEKLLTDTLDLLTKILDR
jgi:AcrR family transcriptional regulator